VQIDFQKSSDFKSFEPLVRVDTENQIKIKMILDRLEAQVLSHIFMAAQTDNSLRIGELRRMFQEAKFRVEG
jgi:hypothetical protein